MYLDNWSIASKGGINYVTLLLKMLVQCSACKRDHRIEETFEVPVASREEKDVIEQVLQEIKKMRPCSFCGALSVLPRKAIERINAELPTKLKGLQLPVRTSADDK